MSWQTEKRRRRRIQLARNAELSARTGMSVEYGDRGYFVVKDHRIIYGPGVGCRSAWKWIERQGASNGQANDAGVVGYFD